MPMIHLLNGLASFGGKIQLLYLITCTLVDAFGDTAAGICQLAVSQSINGNVNGLLRGVGDKNTNEAVKHIVELVFSLLPFGKTPSNVGGGRSFNILWSFEVIILSFSSTIYETLF